MSTFFDHIVQLTSLWDLPKHDDLVISNVTSHCIREPLLRLAVLDDIARRIQLGRCAAQLQARALDYANPMYETPLRVYKKASSIIS